MAGWLTGRVAGSLAGQADCLMGWLAGLTGSYWPVQGKLSRGFLQQGLPTEILNVDMGPCPRKAFKRDYLV